jgi:hypothetical protein
MPEQDTVVTITSGGRDMQAVMNLVWEKLFPALEAAPLPANDVSRERLTKKLAGLTVRPASGGAISPLAATVSGKRFVFPKNDRNIEAAALEFKTDGATLVVRTSSGETRIPCGNGSWRKGQTSFVNGVGGRTVAPREHPVAASGAWTGDDTYTVKLCLYETPFYSTLAFQFNGDQLLFDSEHNVAFGPTKLPQLIGQTTQTE